MSKDPYGGLFKKHRMRRIALQIQQYIQEAKSELKKVVWPSRKETIQHTVLVIGISVGVGLFFAALDFLASKGLELLIDKTH